MILSFPPPLLYIFSDLLQQAHHQECQCRAKRHPHYSYVTETDFGSRISAPSRVAQSRALGKGGHERAARQVIHQVPVTRHGRFCWPCSCLLSSFIVVAITKAGNLLFSFAFLSLFSSEKKNTSILRQSREYLPHNLTEGRATMSKSPTIQPQSRSHGRGGAGNINAKPSKGVDANDLQTPTSTLPLLHPNPPTH